MLYDMKVNSRFIVIEGALYAFFVIKTYILTFASILWYDIFWLMLPFNFTWFNIPSQSIRLFIGKQNNYYISVKLRGIPNKQDFIPWTNLLSRVELFSMVASQRAEGPTSRIVILQSDGRIRFLYSLSHSLHNFSAKYTEVYKRWNWYTSYQCVSGLWNEKISLHLFS